MMATLNLSPFRPRLVVAALALCALTTLARGDGREERDRKARAALALTGNAKPAVASAPAPHAKLPKDYPQGHKDALASQQPLVVFVGCDAWPVDGAVYCSCDAPSFGDAKAPAVVVGYPAGDRLMIDTTIQGCGTPAAVQRAVKDAAKKIDAPPAKAMPAPKPLNWEISAEVPEKLPDVPAKSAARYSLDLPAGAQKYDGAKYTQSISVLMDGGVNRDVIKPFAVKDVPDTRWRQAGGMEGITEYTSERYKYVPSGTQVKVWVGDVEVENSITNPATGQKYRQNNRAMLRSYPDGTRFDEVLTNSTTGVIFEHRVRTKKDGKWLSEVWHKDEAHYPAGYTGLKVSCGSCHNEAGTGKYDTGLVPGGDTVLSDPLPWSVAGLASPEPAAELKVFDGGVEKRATAAKGGCGCCDACTCDSCPPSEKKPAPAATAPKAAVPQYRYQFLGYDRRGNAVYQLAGDGGCSGGSCGFPSQSYYFAPSGGCAGGNCRSK